MAAWDAVVNTDWLEGLVCEEGHTFDHEGAKCTVRAARPGKMLRIWFEEENHKTVLEVMFVATKKKCAIRFRHHQLPDELDVEISRSRWKTALAEILEN